MSLEAKRHARLCAHYREMGDLLARIDFADVEINAYAEMLVCSFEELCPGIGDSIRRKVARRLANLSDEP